MATPFSSQFNWRHIGVFGPYGLVIRYHPQDAPLVDAGDVNDGVNSLGMNYALFVNAGRTGSPGLEVNVTIAAAHSHPRISITICLEPGVHAGREGDNHHYNLHVADTQFLGFAGGGGHMYDHDPPAVHVGVPTALKKETLRIKLTSHGYVCHNPDGLAAIRARLPAGSADAQVLDAMTSTRGTSDTAFNAWFYCRVPMQVRQNFINTALYWFRWMCEQRCQPLFQYPAEMLNLNMEPLPNFRDSMYCSTVMQKGVSVLGPPVLQIADTIGSKSRRTRAVANSVALIRENKAHEEFCIDLGKHWQEIKLVRTSPPVLTKPTRLLKTGNVLPPVYLPADMAVYFGYIYIKRTSRTFPISTPRVGSLFLVTWCTNVQGNIQKTNMIAYGMVLAPNPAITSAGAHFAVSLWIRDPNLRRSAHVNANLAPKSPVELRFIQNRQVPLILLSRMVRFTNFSTNHSVQAVQGNVFRLSGPSSLHDDIHQGPRAPHDDPAEMTRLHGIFQNFAQIVRNSPLMTNIRQVEHDLLFNIPGQISGKTEMIRTTIGDRSFRAVYGLILILVGMGHRIIFVIDEPADRPRICWDLFNLFQRAGARTDYYGNTWRSKRLLSYSSTDVEYNCSSIEDRAAAGSDLSHHGNSLRPALDLFFKMLLGDLPSEDHLYDQGALYNASAAAPAAVQTPQAMSWADYLQIHFNQNPTNREQHFADRARVLNGQVISAEEASGVLNRLKLTRQMILSKADVVVCDSATAMSSDMQASFPGSLIFIGNAPRMTFATGASILLQHPGYIAAFILGNPDDQRHGPVVFASEGRNEAMTTMRRSVWDTYLWAEQWPINLVGGN